MASRSIDVSGAGRGEIESIVGTGFMSYPLGRDNRIETGRLSGDKRRRWPGFFGYGEEYLKVARLL